MISVVIGRYDFFISWHAKKLTMNNCGKLREGVDCMLPQFKEIKDTRVAFSINKILQGCVGMVDGFKRIDAVRTSIVVVLQMIWFSIQILMFCLP